MTIKDYIDDLIDLTKTSQIKWERRAHAGEHMLDCRIDDMNAITIYYDVRMSRVMLTITQSSNYTNISNLDINGATYKSLSRLWDIVVTINLAKTVDVWHKILPQVDKAIKFGPKSDLQIHNKKTDITKENGI